MRFIIVSDPPKDMRQSKRIIAAAATGKMQDKRKLAASSEETAVVAMIPRPPPMIISTPVVPLSDQRLDSVPFASSSTSGGNHHDIIDPSTTDDSYSLSSTTAVVSLYQSWSGSTHTTGYHHGIDESPLELEDIELFVNDIQFCSIAEGATDPIDRSSSSSLTIASSLEVAVEVNGEMAQNEMMPLKKRRRQLEPHELPPVPSIRLPEEQVVCRFINYLGTRRFQQQHTYSTITDQSTTTSISTTRGNFSEEAELTTSHSILDLGLDEKDVLFPLALL